MDRLSRRTVLQAGAAGLLLSACSPDKSSTSGKGPAVEMPQHLPAPPVAGEIRSKYPGLPSAYAKVPDPLRRSWTSKPGDGTSLAMFTIIWGPPAPPLEKNKYWQELNSELGLDLKMLWGPSDSYEAKLATMLASGSLPDVTNLLPSATSDKALRQGAFADIGEAVAGSNMKKYPNLANGITEDVWKNTMVDGRILGVPTSLPAVDFLYTYRRDWARKIGLSGDPANAEELAHYFSEIPKAIPAVDGKTPYGIGAFPGPVMRLVEAMFKVGPEWKVEGGKVTHKLDRPEYEAAVAWCRQLWADHGYHPDALALDAQEIKTISMFESGRLGIMKSSIHYPWTSTSPLYSVMRKNPDVVPLPIPGHDGSQSVWVKSSGWFSRLAISAKAAKDPARLDTILKVLDWTSAPFGTREYMFNRFGMEGRHWNYDAQHAPVTVDNPTVQSELGGLGRYPHVYYYPGNPEGYKKALAYAEGLMKGAVDDPVASISSTVANRVGGVLEKIGDDYLNQIVSGRRPLSDLRQWRDEWHKRGGNDLKADLEKQL